MYIWDFVQYGTSVCNTLNHRSHEVLFVHNELREKLPSRFSILYFWTEHSSDIAMLCAKQINWTTVKEAVDKQDVVRFRFKITPNLHWKS